MVKNFQKLNKKKIIFLVNDLDFVLSHRLELINSLNEKYLVTIIGMSEKKLSYYTKINVAKIFLIKGNQKSIFSLFAFFIKTLYFCYVNKPFLIHTITHIPTIVGILLSRLLGINKLVISFSGLGSYFIKENFIKKMIIFFYKNLIDFKKTFAIVHNVSDYNFINSLGFYKDYIFKTNGSGVDLENIKFKSLKNNKMKYILFVGRLIEDKGISEYVKLAELCKNSNFIFLIAGKFSNSNKSRIKKSAFLNLISDTKNLKFYESPDNIDSLYNKCNVVVLPSYREGFSKVVLEANAHGRPVITFDTIGCGENIIEGKTGYIVEFKNIEVMLEKITMILKNYKLNYELSVSSRDHAIKNFSVKKIIDTHKEIYEKKI